MGSERSDRSIHQGVQDDICESMRLIEHIDLTSETADIGEIRRLARELRAKLEHAYSALGLAFVFLQQFVDFTT